jgi:GDPmannose 4,6-dehydratase
VGIDTNTGNLVIEVDSKYFRPAEVDSLLGDATKARNVLGWKPSTSFEKLVEDMCKNGI